MFTFGELWAGAGGRGRGLPERSDSEILTNDSTRPAPPEGGAANILRASPPAAGLYFVAYGRLACLWLLDRWPAYLFSTVL